MVWKKLFISSLLVSSLAVANASLADAHGAKLVRPTIENMPTINAETKQYYVKGKGTKGAKLKVTVNDGKKRIVQYASVQSNGEFAVPVNVLTLNDGKLTVSVTQTITGEKYTVRKTVLKDTKAPAIPVVTNKGYINMKQQNAYVVKGKAEPYSTVNVSLQNGKQAITKTTKADVKGNFQIVIDARKLADGTVILSVVSIDQAGNRSGEWKGQLVKDVTVQAPSIVNEGYINAFNYDAYPVTGTGTPMEKVTVTMTDGKRAVSGSGYVDEDGNFEIELDTTKLKNGKISVVAKQVDRAGNESKQTTVSLVKDTTQPAKPTIFNQEFINSATDLTSYTVIGKGEVGAEVEVTLSDGTNEVSSVGTVEQDGTYRVEADISSLIDGPITITAFQTSAAGNVSEEETVTVTKDTNIVSPQVNTLQPITAENQATYVISGKGESEAYVQMLVTDGQKSIVQRVKADQNGEFTKTIDVSLLGNGTIIVIVTQQDQAGNDSEGTTGQVTKTS